MIVRRHVLLQIYDEIYYIYLFPFQGSEAKKYCPSHSDVIINVPIILLKDNVIINTMSFVFL